MTTSAINQRVDHLLAMVKLENQRKVKAQNLSGGMQRRLHLILSLIQDPEIIIPRRT